MSEASAGFPWNKVHAARSYLLALKPWLAPIANRTTVVPIDRPTISGYGWLMAPQTDRSGRIYLDRSFCMSQPVHVLAGAFEHEYAKISRGIHSRLSWVAPDDWDEIATPAFQLEIMDAMEREKGFLTPLRIETRIGASQQFSPYDFEDWAVAGPPSLTEAGAVTPELLGLPDGLSAETYAQLLLEAREAAEPLLDAPIDGDEPEGEEGAEDGPFVGGGSGNGGDEPVEDSEDGEGESEAGGEGAEGLASGDSNDSEDPLGLNPAGGDDQKGEAADGDETSDDPVDGGSSDGDDRPDDPSEGEASSGEGPPGEPTDTQDGVTRPEPRTRSTVAQMMEAVGGADDLDSARREAMANPDTFAWSKSVPHYADEFSADVAPPREENVDPATDSQLSEAVNESAKMTMQFASNPGSGVDIRNLQVAHERLRSLGLSWEQHLARVVSSCVISERVKGASDLTYSQPNPNQAELGPRLMGMTDYAPKVTIIQDVSGSMTGAMSLAMDAMSDLMTNLVGRLQARTEWVTAANSIVNVGSAALMTADVRKQWSWGGGGTELGGIIAALMGSGEKLMWKGRRLEVPDLLVVSTDAMFPWPERRPSRAHRLVVVVYQEGHLRYLPDWVDRRTEVVIASV